MEREEIQLLIISSSVVFIILMVTLFAFFFYFQKKKTSFILEKMQSKLHFKNELINTRIEIKDQTLSEISKELHDNIGQILTVALLKIHVLEQKKSPILSEELKDIQECVSSSVNEIRILSRIINKENLAETNFIEALKNDISRVTKLKKFKCVFEVEGEKPEINFEHELFIYRIFQEGIHNILRHSQSTLFDLKIIISVQNIVIKLIDYGVGFDQSVNKNGAGIRNMKLRAKLIGAKLNVTSNKFGSCLLLDYPIPTNHEN